MPKPVEGLWDFVGELFQLGHVETVHVVRVRVVTFGQIEGGVIPVGKKSMVIGLFYLSANFSFN